MNMLKRAFSLFVAFILILSFTACDESKPVDKPGKKVTTSSKEAKDIKLPYSREDGVNPFTAKSLMNNAIVPLMYNGLFRLSANYEAKPDIAESISKDKTDLIVSIGTTARFSNGDRITADDVVYSFNLAKSSLYYGTMLGSISGITAADPYTVVFSTSTVNNYGASLLTFPIVKQNTAQESSVPIGAGPYVYTANADGGILSRNKYYSSKGYKAEKIELENMSDSETLMHSLVIGNVDAVFDDLSKGKSQRINASSTQVDLNNLIFLGVNQSGPFADANIRLALSHIIDRETLLSSGFEGYGAVSQYPFNPLWKETDGLKPDKFSKEDEEALLAQALSGYTINVLVNSDNNFKVKFAEELCSQLNKLGIETKITSVPFETYSSGVSEGQYNLYVGEYKLSADMNISQLISDETLRAEYYEFLAGNITIEDFMKSFDSALPFIPVGFRTGILAYSRSIETVVKPSPGNVFSNLTEWVI